MDIGGHSPEISREGVGHIAAVVAMVLEMISLVVTAPEGVWRSTPSSSPDDAADSLARHTATVQAIARRPAGRRDVREILDALHAAKAVAISLQPHNGTTVARNYPPSGDFAGLVAQLISLITVLEHHLQSYQ